jgi:hypothetical protein
MDKAVLITGAEAAEVAGAAVLPAAHLLAAKVERTTGL